MKQNFRETKMGKVIRGTGYAAAVGAGAFILNSATAKAQMKGADEWLLNINKPKTEQVDSTRQAATGIVPQTPPAHVLNNQVDEAVARARIKGASWNAAPNHRDVRDAADILQRAHRSMAEKCFIEKGNQWSARSSGGKVARPEISDDRNTRALRDDGGCANLQR